MDKELPNRKHPRLDYFDYSVCNAYFITICTQDRQPLLSRIVRQTTESAEVYDTECTPLGKIAQRQLLLLEEKYSFVTVDQYVIMPDHIHIILILTDESSEEKPRPTVMDIMCAYKSLTTKECRKTGFSGKVFQTSFYEHIIRNREDYEETKQYIYNNPNYWKGKK